MYLIYSTEILSFNVIPEHTYAFFLSRHAFRTSVALQAIYYECPTIFELSAPFYHTLHSHPLWLNFDGDMFRPLKPNHSTNCTVSSHQLIPFTAPAQLTPASFVVWYPYCRCSFQPKNKMLD